MKQIYEEVKLHFNNQVIHDLIDRLYINDDSIKERLLHTMWIAYDLTHPVNKKLRQLFDNLEGELKRGKYKD